MTFPKYTATFCSATRAKQNTLSATSVQLYYRKWRSGNRNRTLMFTAPYVSACTSSTQQSMCKSRTCVQSPSSATPNSNGRPGYQRRVFGREMATWRPQTALAQKKRLFSLFGNNPGLFHCAVESPNQTIFIFIYLFFIYKILQARLGS